MRSSYLQMTQVISVYAEKLLDHTHDFDALDRNPIPYGSANVNTSRTIVVRLFLQVKLSYK